LFIFWYIYFFPVDFTRNVILFVGIKTVEFMIFLFQCVKATYDFSLLRNDDREILLECQKRMPSQKTFTYLAVKLNKNPNQVITQFLHVNSFTDILLFIKFTIFCGWGIEPRAMSMLGKHSTIELYPSSRFNLQHLKIHRYLLTCLKMLLIIGLLNSDYRRSMIGIILIFFSPCILPFILYLREFGSYVSLLNKI
jgi:hypothetical protein